MSVLSDLLDEVLVVKVLVVVHHTLGSGLQADLSLDESQSLFLLGTTSLTGKALVVLLLQ